MGKLYYLAEARELRQHVHALECNERAIKIMKDRIARLRVSRQTPDTVEIIRDTEFDIRILEQAREYL